MLNWGEQLGVAIVVDLLIVVTLHPDAGVALHIGGLRRGVVLGGEKENKGITAEMRQTFVESAEQPFAGVDDGLHMSLEGQCAGGVIELGSLVGGEQQSLGTDVLVNGIDGSAVDIGFVFRYHHVESAWLHLVYAFPAGILFAIGVYDCAEQCGCGDADSNNA
mgnify:CR=1 FL=1